MSLVTKSHASVSRSIDPCSCRRLRLHPSGCRDGLLGPDNRNHQGQATLHGGACDYARSDARRADVPQRSAGRWGMLFIYPSEQQVEFWMKNTVIPARHAVHRRRRAYQAHRRAHDSAVETPIPSVDGCARCWRSMAARSTRLGHQDRRHGPLTRPSEILNRRQLSACARASGRRRWAPCSTVTR